MSQALARARTVQAAGPPGVKIALDRLDVVEAEIRAVIKS